MDSELLRPPPAKLESYFLKKIHLTANFLDEMLEEGVFFSAGLIRNGEVITTSAQQDSVADFSELVGIAAPLMNTNHQNLEGGAGLSIALRVAEDFSAAVTCKFQR